MTVSYSVIIDQYIFATYVNSTGVCSREGREDRPVAAGDGGGAVAVRGLLLGGARAHRRHAPRQVLRAVRADLPRRTGETLKRYYMVVHLD